jgi:hypothetical protein
MLLVLLSSAVVGCTVLMSQALRWLGLVLLSSVVIGCTALMSRTPVTQTASFPDAPDVCYQRATRAWMRQGGALTQMLPQAGLLSGTVHNAVTLHILVTATPTGCVITATGAVLPDKIAVGRFTEVGDYIALLQE